MILEADRSLARALGQLSSWPEIVGVHVDTVEHHHDLVVEMHDLHFIPFASGFRRIPMRLEPGNDPACIVVAEFLEALVWIGVVDLHFDAGGDGRRDDQARSE